MDAAVITVGQMPPTTYLPDVIGDGLVDRNPVGGKSEAVGEFGVAVLYEKFGARRRRCSGAPLQGRRLHWALVLP
jgi:hypothetical protein